jgi:hypothetical protein
VGIGWWLSRMNLGGAAQHLPPLRDLGIPFRASRRGVLRPVLLLCCLGAAIAAAAALDRLPSPERVADGWRELRAADFGNPLQRLGDWLSPASTAPATAEHKAATSIRRLPSPPVGMQKRARLASAGSVAPAPNAAGPEPVTDAAPAIEPAVEAASPLAAEPPDSRAGASAARSALHVAAAPTPAPPLRIELAADNYTVLPGEPAARIEVRRRGSLQGDVSFVWSTMSASAQPERDFIASGPRAEQIPAGVSSVTLLVPIVSDVTRSQSRVFYVSIGEPGGGAELGSNSRASVLITGGN